MIYICADDYGLCDSCSAHITECIQNGALNKVSVFTNTDISDISRILVGNKPVFPSLHLNIVEGKALSSQDKIPLLADSDGKFRHSFTGLLKLSLTKRTEFENQVYLEIKEQIKVWKNILPKQMPFMIDSHQHTHMIPAVFKVLMKAVKDEGINVGYLRIPSEPLMPYIMTPSLYLSYKPVNLTKQWLLKLLWQINKREYRKNPIPTALFMGVLFSGNMDIVRVRKILAHYIKKSQKSGKDIEVLFHPGYLDKNEDISEICNPSFESFYYSPGRKTEYNTAMQLNIKK